MSNEQPKPAPSNDMISKGNEEVLGRLIHLEDNVSGLRDTLSKLRDKLKPIRVEDPIPEEPDKPAPDESLPSLPYAPAYRSFHPVFFKIQEIQREVHEITRYVKIMTEHEVEL